MHFALQYKAQTPVEEHAIIMACNVTDGHTYKIYNNHKDVPEGSCPIGTVEWCEKVYDYSFTPDHYPEFLKHRLLREIWYDTKWPQQEGLFVKPAYRYKAWDAKITRSGYSGKKKGPYWISEQVEFTCEWRYYIANGKVLFGEWYDGIEEEDCPPFPSDISIPDTYCGVIDLGRIKDRGIALVEANHPYAVGWYGKSDNIQSKIFLDFNIQSYYYLNKLIKA